MEKAEIMNQLTGIFRKIFNDGSLILNEELTANDVSNWDSLSHMLLINDIEQHFAIKFKLRELNRLKNVGVLIEIIESKLEV